MAKKLSVRKTAPAAVAPAVGVPARKKPAASPKLSVSVDYPQEGERVLPGHYAVRITAAGAEAVEVRLDGTDWLACRESLGHFWYDWAPQKPGPVTLAARARRGKGRWAASPERSCFVEG